MKATTHDIVPNVILTFVTCGLYGLWWMARLNDDIHELSGRPGTTGIKAAIFSVVTCSLYFYYWIYKTGGELAETRKSSGLSLDSVPNGMYAAAICLTTPIIAAFSSLNALGTIDDETIENMTPEEVLMLVFVLLAGGFVMSFLVQSVFSALLLFFVYKRSDPDPRALYTAMAILRTNIFTLAFVQASANDLITARRSTAPVPV